MVLLLELSSGITSHEKLVCELMAFQLQIMLRSLQ